MAYSDLVGLRPFAVVSWVLALGQAAEDKLASIVCFENSKLQFVLVRRAAACGVKGRAFLQTAINHWRKGNPKSKSLNAVTHEDNAAALKCYAACGFDGERKEGCMRRLRISFE